MKKKNIAIGAIFSFIILYLCYGYATNNFVDNEKKSIVKYTNESSVPFINHTDSDDTTNNTIEGQFVQHQYYSFLYSEKHEQPFWVSYVLTKKMLENPITKRKDNFRPDPKVKTGSAELIDYVGSGFDRGHLCPAKDMESTVIGMSESFFMSNMSPQHPSLNRGRWKQLEGQVRKWSLAYDSLVIYCGGVLDSISDYIGPNKVAVPKYYYKIVYSVKENEGIGFIMPNMKCESNLSRYAVSIDSVESATRINFFQDYPEDLQANFESKFKLKHWFKSY